MASGGIGAGSAPLDNVSLAFRVMGCSHNREYLFKVLHDQGGEAAREELRRRGPRVENQVTEAIEEKNTSHQWSHDCQDIPSSLNLASLEVVS